MGQRRRNPSKMARAVRARVMRRCERPLRRLPRCNNRAVGRAAASRIALSRPCRPVQLEEEGGEAVGPRVGHALALLDGGFGGVADVAEVLDAELTFHHALLVHGAAPDGGVWAELAPVGGLLGERLQPFEADAVAEDVQAGGGLELAGVAGLPSLGDLLDHGLV